MMGHLEKMGFTRGLIPYGIRTALAACVALLLAWLIGLEHPQWAAMSVWAASQPLRGLLFEKSFFRVCGTIVGTIAGITLVQLGNVTPWALVIGLGVWLALCTGIQNLLRGFMAYGSVLAGYTAAMVALIDVSPEADVFALGADRMATVLLGVAVTTIAAFFFAPKTSAAAGTRAKVRLMLADILENVSKDMNDPSRVPSGEMLSRIGAIEESLDPQAAGSRRSHREVRETRAILIAAIAVHLQRGRAELAPCSRPESTANALLDAAFDLRADNLPAAIENLARAAQLCPSHAPTMAEAITDLRESLAAWGPDQGRRVRRSLALHRDWIGAREAAIRTLIAIWGVGAFWLLSGWGSGNFALLGLSIMITLFSNFENPAIMMKSVFTGQLVAISLVMVCRWLVWPLASSEFELVLMLLPFIASGAIMITHPKLMPYAFDYNMVFLLLMQPNWPLAGTPSDTLMAAFGVLMGPMAAFAIYRLVFPTNLKRRIETLKRMMLRDLADLAKHPEAWDNRYAWRARLYHRTLRLLRMSERNGRKRSEAITMGVNSLTAADAIIRLHLALETKGQSDSFYRACRAGLERAARFETQPEKAMSALMIALARARETTSS